MNKFKSSLLAATVLVAAAAAPAYADTALPLGTNLVIGTVINPVTHNYDYSFSTTATTLHGAGASSIENIVARNANCIGPDMQKGKSSSTTALSTVSPGSFTGDPAQNCATEGSNIQPNISAQYVSTGSGFGRTMWAEFGDNFQGGAGLHPTTGVFNPFGQTTPWSNLHFAFSDAGLSQAELISYNTNAAPKAGPAISFPLFVLPVAIAYPTTYGTNAAGTSMVFNAQGKGMTTANGTVLAALNLTKAVYCGIFNGTITNWNDPAIQLINGSNKVAIQTPLNANGPKKVNQVNIGIPLFDPINDTATRWTADGAPIRLVGRLDKSGTTDVFTRHLAAVCNSTNGFAGTNNYTKAAETLPYGTATGVDFRSVRSDSNYFPTVASSKLAGTTNMASGDYWNGSAVVNIGSGSVGFPSTAGSTSMPSGSVGSGLYLLADGGGKVASAISAIPDYSYHGVLLNGKIGYISADFIQPSVDAPGGLNAAALQTVSGAFPQVSYTAGTNAYVRVDAKYAVPTVKATLLALSAIAPPALTGDTRLVTPVTGTTKVGATRDNPLAWTEVLYAGTATLADPQTTGNYPIAGTTQFFGYTCYAPETRQAMVNHLGLVLGQINKNSAGNIQSKMIFGGTVPSYPGIDVQSNIGVVPAAWATAITETFLKSGTGSLWIQDALSPTYNGAVTLVPKIVADNLANPKVIGATAIKGLGVKTATAANSACSSITGPGA